MKRLKCYQVINNQQCHTVKIHVKTDCKFEKKM